MSDIFNGPELAANDANYVPLSPVSLLARTAKVHPERTAVIHGDVRRTYAEMEARCRRLASALQKRGVAKGHTVAVLAPNIPEVVEAHFAVPMLGAVLNANNTRLDADTIAYILDHGEASVFIVDTELAPIAEAALAKAARKDILVIDIEDPAAQSGHRIGSMTYEDLLAEGDPDFSYGPPANEWDSLTLNYTSGTTGNPKGVVYSHRGAYLNAVNNSVCWNIGHHPVYLWTLPMFHCNGWCFPWTITMLAGTHVCLRRVEAGPIYDAIADHGVTHLCGAPIVMSMIAGAAESDRREFSHKVDFMTAAAPPPPAVISAIEALGISITHVYGLTEVYGPAVVCAWKDEWNALPESERASKKARQGVEYELQESCLVLDPDTHKPVPWDGETMGEVCLRGNIVMKGYLKAPEATAKAFEGGWFWSGDLAVCHPDGFIEIRDRSKDIIISGGENISSIEIEKVLFAHPSVALAAVVAQPDEKWGESPCAFIELRPGMEADEEALTAHCREHLAGFKRPKRFVFGELPKTSTGKVQKFELRKQVV